MGVKRHLFIALWLVAPALLLVPAERQIHWERTELKFGGPRMTLQVRDQIGQGMAIGLLAGFRGVVADFLWIQAHGYWQEKLGLRMYRNLELVTTLQPQSVLFWDEGAWHLAWNAAFWARRDPANRTEAEGIKHEREWWDRGRELLERGLGNIPGRYDLYFALGWLYHEKYKDFCKASELLGRAAEYDEAPTYVGRLYARSLERCGDVEGAYEYWKFLWSQDHSNPKQTWDVIRREIKRMEELLQVPVAERIFPTAPDSTS